MTCLIKQEIVDSRWKTKKHAPNKHPLNTSFVVSANVTANLFSWISFNSNSFISIVSKFKKKNEIRIADSTAFNLSEIFVTQWQLNQWACHKLRSKSDRNYTSCEYLSISCIFIDNLIILWVFYRDNISLHRQSVNNERGVEARVDFPIPWETRWVINCKNNILPIMVWYCNYFNHSPSTSTLSSIYSGKIDNYLKLLAGY